MHRLRSLLVVGSLVPAALLQSAPAHAQTAAAAPPPAASAGMPPAGAVPAPAPVAPPPGAEPAPPPPAMPPGAPLAPTPLGAGAGAAPVVAQPAPPPPPAPYEGPPLLLQPKQGKAAIGGYGGVGVSYTHMLHRDGALVDFSGSVVLQHRLALGLAGYVFSRTPSGPNLGVLPREYTTAYGGFVIRYAVYTENLPVYGSIGALIGGGAIGLVEDFDREYNDDYHSHYNGDWHGYFVFQPDVALHANATRWLRFSVFGGYRVATAVHEFNYDSTAVSGGIVGGRIEFGWF